MTDNATDIERLWYDYHDKIQSYIARRTRDVDAIEDLTSVVFLKAVEALAAGNGPQVHETGWLFRIAHNLLIDEYRWRNHHQYVSIDKCEYLLEAVNNEMDEHAIDVRVTLDRELRRLTPEQAEAFGLWADGYTSQEMGEILDLNPAAAKGLAQRAKTNLRPALSAISGRRPSTTTMVQTITKAIRLYGPMTTWQIARRTRISRDLAATTLRTHRAFVTVGKTCFRRSLLSIYGLAGVHDKEAA